MGVTTAHLDSRKRRSELGINLERETVLRITQGDKLPTKPCRLTLWRYIHEGRENRLTGQRVFLEHKQVGGIYYTTKEAFSRFCDRLTSDEPYAVGEG